MLHIEEVVSVAHEDARKLTIAEVAAAKIDNVPISADKTDSEQGHRFMRILGPIRPQEGRE